MKTALSIRGNGRRYFLMGMEELTESLDKGNFDNAVVCLQRKFVELTNAEIVKMLHVNRPSRKGKKEPL
ncbi:hypothetical protein [Parapedobacter tibetensis]|uniref:hypothetical protein n=1 Tax=Parapedobacter tibetensis TaxID=2972951 RepID=UPI00214D159B|nr:hypothetical protein [Parapedobacter tibetensis]